MTNFIRLSFLFLLITCGLTSTTFASDCQEQDLMNDLLVVDYWNKKVNERYPVMYNHVLQGGYYAMPSARMGEDGEIGFGYSHVPPYGNYNLRCQVLDQLEITGNYRIFKGVKDPVLSKYGFGDFSDKGANFKFSLLKAEESNYKLPSIAVGLEDFIGTSAFHAQYIVVTQVLLDMNLELSLGYGKGRIKGFFGGVNWMPFRQSEWKYLQMLSLAAEYDAIPYHKEIIEKHPKGRIKKSPINAGLKYRLWDSFDFSYSYIRGTEHAFAMSTYYNFGYSTGFIPKIDDAMPYKAPINTEPLGERRPEETLATELVFAFEEQGFSLMKVLLSYDECNRKILRLTILNENYRIEEAVRVRLNHLFAALIPSDIDEVIAVIDSEGFPIQQYRYDMNLMRLYASHEIGPYELRLLTPLEEATFPADYSYTTLFSRDRGLYNFEILPRTHTLFGSASGKFKYDLGFNTAFNGFLWDDIYYNVLVGCNLLTNIGDTTDFDRLNPSQLINVRSDVVRYYKQKWFTLDQAYLQKNWSFGRGLYSRVSTGYFEQEYGGIATEVLYYPVNSAWAIGLRGAALKKRSYKGLGFTDRVRKLKGFDVTYRKFHGSQYFLDLYYDWEAAHLDFRISAGKFLANDWGVRNEISRYFPSGMRLTLWYTWTNGNDKVNKKTYHDKGVCISIPFDFISTYSERSRWNYGMSAWLRDVGVQAEEGLQLYDLINEQRQ